MSDDCREPVPPTDGEGTPRGSTCRRGTSGGLTVALLSEHRRPSAPEAKHTDASRRSAREGRQVTKSDVTQLLQALDAGNHAQTLSRIHAARRDVAAQQVFRRPKRERNTHPKLMCNERTTMALRMNIQPSPHSSEMSPVGGDAEGNRGERSSRESRPGIPGSKIHTERLLRLRVQARVPYPRGNSHSAGAARTTEPLKIHGRSIPEGKPEEILPKECRSLLFCRKEESGHR